MEVSAFRKMFGRLAKKPTATCYLPKISVIIATRNNESTIEAALRSVLEQNYGNIELVVVEDKSDDDTASRIASFANRLDNIVVINNRVQIGTGASRNLGLARCSGEIVTFQDGDDVSLEGRLLAQFDILARFPKIKLVLCDYVRLSPAGEVVSVNGKRQMKCIISMMFRRAEIIDTVGYFRSESVSEDADFYERIKAFYGNFAIKRLREIKYHALYNPTSNFFGSGSIAATPDCMDIIFEKGSESARRWAQLKAEHVRMRRGTLSCYIPLSPYVE